MYRTFLVAGCFCALATGTVSLGNAQGPARSTVHAISIKNYTFVPAVVTIAPGDTIVWTNKDKDNHTVTSDLGSSVMFRSRTLAKNGVFKHTFKRAGTIHYHCEFHPFMNAIVKIKGHAA